VGRACDSEGETRNTYKFVVGTSEEKRQLERRRRRSEANLKVGRGDNVLKSADLICLVQDADRRLAAVNTVIKLRNPRNTGIF
jgi:hypothetical protein